MGLDEKIEVSAFGIKRQFDTVKGAVEYINEILLNGGSITSVDWVYILTGKVKKNYDIFFNDINKLQNKKD